jgi:hypothetical protein
MDIEQTFGAEVLEARHNAEIARKHDRPYLTVESLIEGALADLWRAGRRAPTPVRISKRSPIGTSRAMCYLARAIGATSFRSVRVDPSAVQKNAPAGERRRGRSYWVCNALFSHCSATGR